MRLDDRVKSFAQLSENGCSIDSEEWTEADTRSKFIDTVLLNCLGWSEADIRRELSKDGKRLDLLLSTTRPVLVIEAKKASVEFPILKGSSVSRYQIDTFMKVNPGARQNLLQVVEYCRRFSAPLAVLTNGRSYIVFLAVRTDGIPWEAGEAIVLANIFAEQANFADLYNRLSRDSIISGMLLTELLAHGIPIQAQSVVGTYADPNAVIPRNPIGLALEPLLVQVFSDVTREDSREVLEHCYVLPGETTLRNEDFEALLLDKPPRFADAVFDVCSRNSFERFQESIKDYLGRARWAQTVFVIGGVGVGKTMFLRRYFTVVSPADPASRGTCAFYIDFRKPGLDPKEIPTLIFGKLREQILDLDGQEVPGEASGVHYDFVSADGLRQVFWPHVQRFMKGPEGGLKDIDTCEFEKARIRCLSRLQEDDREFVKGVFRVLRERYHQRVCVVLDNADQCKPDYQEAIYVFSRTLEDVLQCLIIVALREEWYWHFGSSGGPLSAYHDVVYHIPAPRVRDVLARRLDYAIQLLEEYDVPPAITPLSGGIVLEAKHLTQYLRCCRSAFFQDEETTVFYECLSNGSIRKGLDMFLGFLRSGHTHVDEYLKAFIQRGTYTIRFHQVFKPISRGQYAYYASNRSAVPNIFTPVTGVAGMQLSHFAPLYLLNYLSFHAGKTTHAGRGFVPVAAADQFLRNLGMTGEVRRSVLTQLSSLQLIEPDVKMVPTFEEWAYVRITAFGLYLIRVLVTRFSYIEAVMLDTPLANLEIHKRISGLYLEGTKPSLHQRVLCARDFLNFLRKEEVLEQARVQSSGIGAQCPEVMSQVIDRAISQFEILEELAREDTSAQNA